MDDDPKTIDITPRDYDVKEGKRKEPIFNKGYILPFLLFIAVGLLTKALWLWAMGRL